MDGVPTRRRRDRIRRGIGGAGRPSKAPDLVMTTFTVSQRRGRFQQRRDHGNQARRWTARNELRHRLPGIHDSEVRRKVLRALASRSRHEENLALDVLIVKEEREDGGELPADRDVVPTYPPLGDEVFNLTHEELQEVWREPAE
jgi:hypothetical protein